MGWGKGQQGECRRLGTLPGDGRRGIFYIMGIEKGWGYYRGDGGMKKVGDTTGGWGKGQQGDCRRLGTLPGDGGRGIFYSI